MNTLNTNAEACPPVSHARTTTRPGEGGESTKQEHARKSQRIARTADKMREYILGRQQFKLNEGMPAPVQTPGEAIDELLEQEESRRIRALAPKPRKKAHRL